MNQRTIRAAKKAASDASRATAAMVMPDFAALGQEQYSLGQHVIALEKRITEIGQSCGQADSFRHRSFLGRLRWLFFGM
jgi:hypothetical protein